MRVISGSAKGRPLKAPAGMCTRPMTDRIKESLFNILRVMGYPAEDDRVLDLYAGTGSLGIEALSRGAAWADFVDQGHEPLRCVTANLAATGLAARGRAHQMAVRTFLRTQGPSAPPGRATPHDPGKYAIIFCDPPYADPAVPQVLDDLAAWPGFDPDGVLVFGHATQVALPDAVGDLVRVRYRKWGGSAFSLYRGAAAAAQASATGAVAGADDGDGEE